MTVASMRSIVMVLARLGLVSAALMTPCLLLAAWDEGPTGRTSLAFLLPILLCVAFFGAQRLAFGQHRPALKDASEGFYCVVFGWVLFGLVGALPFLISGTLKGYADAWFESVSGYTTCGASVFPSVEVLPRCILLWRALTHFAGGLGIIALYVAILPALGAGGVVLFRSEAQASVFEDRLRPRIHDTAKTLLLIYTGLVGAECLILWILCGVPFFDAFCHAAATLSTGGFSTRDASVAAFGPAAQWVIIVFMLMGGTSFLLHSKALRGEFGAYPRSAEFRAYACFVLVSVVIVFTSLWMREPQPATVVPMEHVLDASMRPRDLHTTIRDSFFAVTTAMTCTGFATADFNRWPEACRFLLTVLMLVGGCTASTAGGMKVSRIVVFLRTVAREISTLVRPSRVVAVRFGQNTLPTDALVAVSSFLVLYLVVLALAVMMLTLSGLPITESLSGSIAAMGNVGPGLGAVGPASNFGHVSTFAKLVFTTLMLLGRLEIFAVLALFASVKRRS